MVFQIVLVALCAQLALSSSPKATLDFNDSPGRNPALSALENVQELLTHHITSLKVLLGEITGLTCESGDTRLGHDTFVCFLCPMGCVSVMTWQTQDILGTPRMAIDAQKPLDATLDGVTGLELLTRPQIPSRPLPFLPIPPTWRRQLYAASECKCTNCFPVTPNTSCCRNICMTIPLSFHPRNQTKLGPVGVEDARGSQVPIEAQTDLTLLASFISNELVQNLGLEQNIRPYPKPGEQNVRPDAIIVGTIPIFLANFTQEQLKIKDEFYVIDILGSDNEQARFPDLFIGTELLRQINGLVIDPAVIV